MTPTNGILLGRVYITRVLDRSKMTRSRVGVMAFSNMVEEKLDSRKPLQKQNTYWDRKE